MISLLENECSLNGEETQNLLAVKKILAFYALRRYKKLVEFPLANIYYYNPPPHYIILRFLFQCVTAVTAE